MNLHDQATTYERVTGRQSYQYAYSPADTDADTRYVFADTDNRFRGDKRAAEQHMQDLLDDAQADATEAVYDTLRGNTDLRIHTNRIRAANPDATDHALGGTVIAALEVHVETFHGPTGESAKPYGSATVHDVLAVMKAAGVEIGVHDVAQLTDLVSAENLGRMIRRTRDEDLDRKGMR